MIYFCLFECCLLVVYLQSQDKLSFVSTLNKFECDSTRAIVFLKKNKKNCCSCRTKKNVCYLYYMYQ